MQALGYERVPWYCNNCHRQHIEWFRAEADVFEFWENVVCPMLEELRKKLEG